MRCFHILGNQVSFGGAVPRIVAATFRIEQTEPIVMPCGENHILAAGLFCDVNPLFRIELLACELVPQMRIFCSINPLIPHNPLASTRYCI